MSDDDPFGSLALPIVLDRYAIVGNGPGGGSSYRFGRWLERWRGVPNVRVLISSDYHDAIVVPADLRLKRDERTGLYVAPAEVLPL